MPTTHLTYRIDPTTVVVRLAGRGVVGEVVRIETPKGRRFEARIAKCGWGRFARQGDAVAEVALRFESIERGEALLAGWRP